MNDQELVCNFMEPRPALPDYWADTQSSPDNWWTLIAIAGGSMKWWPRTMDLEALHKVEENLSDEQWMVYQNNLFDQIGPVASFSEGINKLIHATADQRTGALAKVLRP